MRAIFFGTPEFAVPALEALKAIADVRLVVCQPDKPVGRGLTLSAPAVKVRAEALGIPVVQPVKVRTGELAALVREQNADVALVIAYGRILPDDVLAGPRLGCVNVHGSILPRYRGAAPIAWAIVRGETETGISLMQMDAGMDTGAVLEIRKTPIGPEETTTEVAKRLSEIGAESVREGLPRFVAGELKSVPQENEGVTLAPILKKEDGFIEWRLDAACIHDRVRGLNPWPMGAFRHQGKRVIVHATRVAFDAPSGSKPGQIVIADKSRVVVACGADRAEGYVGHVANDRRCIELVRIQLEGKKPIRGADWFLGRGVAEGDVLA